MITDKKKKIIEDDAFSIILTIF